MTTTNNTSLTATNFKMLETIFEYGIEVFGTKKNFETWLKKENFFFDKKAPIEFMNTIEGIKFIDGRLTGIAYGNNA